MPSNDDCSEARLHDTVALREFWSVLAGEVCGQSPQAAVDKHVVDDHLLSAASCVQPQEAPLFVSEWHSNSKTPQMQLCDLSGVCTQQIGDMQLCDLKLCDKGSASTDVWTPGANVDGWIGRGRGGRRIEPQTKVIIANAYVVLSRLPAHARTTIRQHFEPQPGRLSKSVAIQIMSAFVCMKMKTLENLVAELEANDYKVNRKDGALQPEPHQTEQALQNATACDEQIANGGKRDKQLCKQRANPKVDSAQAAEFLMMNLVRFCIAGCVRGDPQIRYCENINLMALADADVGDTNHSEEFAVACEAVAFQELADIINHALQNDLGGIGVPADMELIADGGTIGKYYSRGRDNMLFIGIVISVPHPPWSLAILLDVVNEAGDGRSGAAVQHIRSAFHTRLQRGWRATLETRIAIAGGDGPMVPGGKDARHKSGQDAPLNSMWAQVPSRKPRWMWDPFHLVDLAGSRPMKLEIAEDFKLLVKLLDRMFGMGHGRHIDRAVTTSLATDADQNIVTKGYKYKTCKSACGTRQIVYFCEVPARFNEKFKSFYYGLIVRMRQKAFDKHGTKSHKTLRELGQRLCSIKSNVFAMIMAPALNASIRPVGLICQDITALPWCRWQSLQDTILQISRIVAGLVRFRRAMRVLLLIRPYLTAREVRRWWCAQVFSPESKMFFHCKTNFYAECFPLLFRGERHNCDLMIAPSEEVEGMTFLHPICQCCSRRKGHVPNFGHKFDAHVMAWKVRVGHTTFHGHKVKAPHWVASTVYASMHLSESRTVVQIDCCAF